MVDGLAVVLQEHSQPAVSKAWSLPRQFRQPGPQFRIAVRLWLVPVAAAIQATKLASAAFAQVILLHRERHVLPAAYELHPFFEITALSTSRSRLKSATRCFRRRFSSSTCRNRFASLTCMPPYFPFHAYSVAALTPNSRATSAVLRPPSICFTAAMTFSSVCRLFFISNSPFQNWRILV